jgi:superfamily I DNA/RNA helicase
MRFFVMRRSPADSVSSPPKSHAGGFHATTKMAVASSCADLIAAGVKPDQIMILLSSVPTLASELIEALKNANVPFRPAREKPLCNTEPSCRLGLALLRLVADSTDYLALRTVLGLHSGVGAGTCNAIAVTIHANNLNYRNVFVNPLPMGFLLGDH